jgi:transposase-like protein
MTPKEARYEKPEAKAQFALRAVELMDTGATIKSIARDFHVRASDLTKWIRRFRERGFNAFHRRRLPPRWPLRTPAAIKEAFRREKIVVDAFCMMARGDSRNWAARKLRVPGCQLYRWCRAYKAEGFSGLLPRGPRFGKKRGL